MLHLRVSASCVRSLLSFLLAAFLLRLVSMSLLLPPIRLLLPLTRHSASSRARLRDGPLVCLAAADHRSNSLNGSKGALKAKDLPWACAKETEEQLRAQGAAEWLDDRSWRVGTKGVPSCKGNAHTANRDDEKLEGKGAEHRERKEHPPKGLAVYETVPGGREGGGYLDLRVHLRKCHRLHRVVTIFNFDNELNVPMPLGWVAEIGGVSRV